MPAHSAIVSTTGEVSGLSAPPASVAAGGAEDNNLTRVFLEQTLTLQSNLTVDNTATGTYGPNGMGNGSPGVVIPAGEIISSYFFDFDPVGTSCCGNSVGSVTFDREILGVIFTDSRRHSTDSLLRAPGTAYSPTVNSDIDTFSNDSFAISSPSSNRWKIEFNLWVENGQDQMRVIVSADADDDGADDPADNCPFTANPDQADADGDNQGDECDGDLDGDGVLNAMNNCPTIANSSQNDFDGDGAGDVCDADLDDDGVANTLDLCDFTPMGEVVDAATGCSIAELVPCAGPLGSTEPWKSHGAYVSSVVTTVNSFVKQGLITEVEALRDAAAQSTCGDK